MPNTMLNFLQFYLHNSLLFEKFGSKAQAHSNAYKTSSLWQTLHYTTILSALKKKEVSSFTLKNISK